MKKDWIGYWYVLNKKRGKNDLNTFGNLHPTNTNKNSWYHPSHIDTDGYGAFCEILKENNYELKSSNNNSKIKKPNIFSRVRVLKAGLSNMESVRTNWKNFNPDISSADLKDINYVHLDTQESEKLDSYFKNKKYSFNSFLLNLFNETYLNALISTPDHGKILVPVDMRKGLPKNMHHMNCSSGIYVKLHKSDSVYEIHEKIKTNLIKKCHWGNWWLGNIGKVAGKKVVSRLSEKSSRNSFYIGTFSNMGEWNYTPQKESSKISNIWVCSAPSSPNYPLFLGLMKVNGEYTISIRVHPSITTDVDVINNCYDNFKKQIKAIIKEEL